MLFYCTLLKIARKTGSDVHGSPNGGARRLVGQVLSKGIAFSRRAGRAPALSKGFVTQNATARGAYYHAALKHTLFLPSSHHL